MKRVHASGFFFSSQIKNLFLHKFQLRYMKKCHDNTTGPYMRMNEWVIKGSANWFWCLSFVSLLMRCSENVMWYRRRQCESASNMEETFYYVLLFLCVCVYFLLLIIYIFFVQTKKNVLPTILEEDTIKNCSPRGDLLHLQRYLVSYNVVTWSTGKKIENRHVRR